MKKIVSISIDFESVSYSFYFKWTRLHFVIFFLSFSSFFFPFICWIIIWPELLLCVRFFSARDSKLPEKTHEISQNEKKKNNKRTNEKKKR